MWRVPLIIGDVAITENAVAGWRVFHARNVHIECQVVDTSRWARVSTREPSLQVVKIIVSPWICGSAEDINCRWDGPADLSSSWVRAERVVV